MDLGRMIWFSLFWIIGLLRVAYEAIKNVILNAQLEKRLHQG